MILDMPLLRVICWAILFLTKLQYSGYDEYEFFTLKQEVQLYL